MQLEVILAGNRKASRVLWDRDNLRVNKDEIVYVSLLSKVLSLD